MCRAKNDNSEPRMHLTGNSEFSESSKLSLRPFLNCCTCVNEKLDNFHSSLTMNNRKLILYFRSPLYAIVSNITHCLIRFGMRGKMACFELCFTCTDAKSMYWAVHNAGHNLLKLPCTMAVHS